MEITAGNEFTVDGSGSKTVVMHQRLGDGLKLLDSAVAAIYDVNVSSLAESNARWILEVPRGAPVAPPPGY